MEAVDAAARWAIVSARAGATQVEVGAAAGVGGGSRCPRRRGGSAGDGSGDCSGGDDGDNGGGERGRCGNGPGVHTGRVHGRFVYQGHHPRLRRHGLHGLGVGSSG